MRSALPYLAAAMALPVQAGVVDGGGGGHADGPGLLGGRGDFARIGGRAVQRAEEAVPEVRLTILGGQSHALRGEEPADEGPGAGGVDSHAAGSIAAGVNKGGVGVHRQ